MEEIARRLLPGFKDPHKPTFCTACVFCLRGQLKSESDKEYKATLRLLRRNSHDLLTGIMLFLTTMHTDEERAPLTAQLKAVMRRCPLGPGHPDITANLVNSDLLECAVILLFDLVHESFAGAARMLQKQSFNRNGVWPTSAAQLLPLGARASCPALLRWFTKLHECQVYMTFMDIFLLCPDVMSTIVDEEMYRVAFLRALVGHLDLAVADHARWPHRSDEDDSQAPLSLLRHLSILLAGIRASPVGGRRSFGKLINGAEDALLRSVMRAADTVKDVEAKERLHNFALGIHHARGTKPDELPVCLQNRLDAWLEGAGGTYESSYDLLRTVGDRRVCAAAGCGKPEHELEKRLLVCSQCHLVRYCTKECQKTHWKSGKTPHNDVCPLLKELFQLADLKLEREEFAEVCRKADVSQDLLDRICHGIRADSRGGRVNPGARAL